MSIDPKVEEPTRELLGHAIRGVNSTSSLT